MSANIRFISCALMLLGAVSAQAQWQRYSMTVLSTSDLNVRGITSNGEVYGGKFAYNTANVREELNFGAGYENYVVRSRNSSGNMIIETTGGFSGSLLHDGSVRLLDYSTGDMNSSLTTKFQTIADSNLCIGTKVEFSAFGTHLIWRTHGAFFEGRVFHFTDGYTPLIADNETYISAYIETGWLQSAVFRVHQGLYSNGTITQDWLKSSAHNGKFIVTSQSTSQSFLLDTVANTRTLVPYEPVGGETMTDNLLSFWGGTTTIPSRIYSPFLGHIDLQSQVNSSGASLTMNSAVFHNRYGQLTTIAKINGVDSLVRLDPVPEPGSMIALGAGIAGLVSRRRKLIKANTNIA